MATQAARRASAVVVPTLAVREALHEVLDVGVPVTVIGEGIAPALRPPRDAQERAERLELPESYILFSGTPEPRKGLDTLMSALRRSEAPEVPLLLTGGAGWGGVDAVLDRDAQSLGPGRVRRLGRLSDQDLAVVMSRATVLAVPSRAEGFGLPVIEAQSLGTAVVCSDSPALVEVAGGAARVVPRGDDAALARALSDVVGSERQRSALVREGRKNALRFSWDLAARRLWALYRSLS